MKPGPKGRSEADRLSAMVWAKAVEIATNGLNPHSIELQFMPEECIKEVGGVRKPPKLMKRYAAGEITPTKRGRACGGLDFVERIEVEYPGTSKWLYHPLWELLQPKEYGLAQLHQLMLQLNGPFIGKFFSNTDWPEKTFVRNYSAIQVGDIKSIASHENLDSFAFLLGLLREAEIRMDILPHFNSGKYMKQLFPVVANFPQIQPFAGILFDYLENTFFKMIYNAPDGSEMYFAERWRDQFPDLAVTYPVFSGTNSKKETRRLLYPVKRKPSGKEGLQ